MANIPMTDERTPPPRVFISYSWTSEEHAEWIGDLGQRLMTDGVDVVLDQWSLEHGHDVNAFMEQMVTDPSIKRVIIVSDALYAAKADNRKGGVGTETQIISKEVYDSVEQTKFVPVLRERDENGNPCLPVFLKSRKFIDFSDLDNEAEAYDQLLRNIFERPLRRKPALGTAPSHLFIDEGTVVTSVQKARRFRDFVTNGRGNPSAAFEDFAEEFLGNVSDLRMAYKKEEAATWCDRIRANIATATTHRDAFVDAIKTGVSHLPSQQFMPLLLGLLERLLAFQESPNTGGLSYKVSEDNYRLMCYELFLYSFAVFIKARKFSEARQLLEYRYVVPKTFGGENVASRKFTTFNEYAESLEELCAQSGDRRRLSVMADLVHDRANRKDLRFSDVMQADIVLALATKGYGWFPRCMVYASSTGKCELFLRAVTDDGFSPLKQLLNLNSPQELLQLLDSDDMRKVLRSEKLWYADMALECLNVEELRRCWRVPAS